MTKKLASESSTSEPIMEYVRVKLNIAQVGNIRWVSTTGSDTTGYGTFDRPYRTVDCAVGKCIPNNNDVIAVKPGAYDENKDMHGVTVDVPGIIILGSANPASVTVENSKSSMPAPKCVFYVSAPNVTICNLTINETTNYVTGIQTAAEYTIIQNVIFVGTMKIGIMTFNHTTIRDCWFENNAVDGIQVNFANDIIEHNFLVNIGGTAINILCKADGHHNFVHKNVINGAGVTVTGIAAVGDNNLISHNVVGGCTSWNSDTGTGNIWIDNKTA